MYLQIIALALDGSFCGEDAHVARLGERSDHFCRRTDDAQHSSVGVQLWKVVLLNRTECFGRSGVTSQDDEMAPHRKEALHGLSGELIYYVKRTRTVGGTSVIAQIEIVVLG